MKMKRNITEHKEVYASFMRLKKKPMEMDLSVQMEQEEEEAYGTEAKPNQANYRSH